MFDDGIMPGERIGEQNQREKRGEYADRWEGAMEGDDVPEFAGEWGYGEASDNEESAEDTSIDAAPGNGLEQNVQPISELGDASRLTSYGFDTASRMYGLGAVIDAIMETDETTSENAENPVGAIYARLAPNPDQRKFLYDEIQKDRVVENQYNNDPSLNSENSKLGFTASGDFYDKVPQQATSEQTSIDAIRALRRIMQILETSEKFTDVRERAAAQQKSIVEYLVSDQANPTLSHLLNRIGTEMSEDELEELVEDIEAEAGNEATEAQNADQATATPESTPSEWGNMASEVKFAGPQNPEGIPPITDQTLE